MLRRGRFSGLIIRCWRLLSFENFFLVLHRVFSELFLYGLLVAKFVSFFNFFSLLRCIFDLIEKFSLDLLYFLFYAIYFMNILLIFFRENFLYFVWSSRACTEIVFLWLSMKKLSPLRIKMISTSTCQQRMKSSRWDKLWLKILVIIGLRWSKTVLLNISSVRPLRGFILLFEPTKLSVASLLGHLNLELCCGSIGTVRRIPLVAWRSLRTLLDLIGALAFFEALLRNWILSKAALEMVVTLNWWSCCEVMMHLLLWILNYLLKLFSLFAEFFVSLDSLLISFFGMGPSYVLRGCSLICNTSFSVFSQLSKLSKQCLFIYKLWLNYSLYFKKKIKKCSYLNSLILSIYRRIIKYRIVNL